MSLKMISGKRCSPLRECVLVLGRADMIPAAEGDLIGVDRGALFCAAAGRRMKVALGDFDSVTEEELTLIESMADEVIRLDPVKDDSDSEAALKEMLRRGYERVTMAGGLGGRTDHEYVNVKLAARYPGIVILENKRNRILALGPGRYSFSKGEYKYFSVFPLTACEISIEGMKYPLDRRRMGTDDLYGLSNEITADRGILEVHSGTVLTMRTSDGE